MFTTTRCLFALGLSVSLFAACGDDDDDGFGGGSGGRAGSGGRGGTGGGGTGGGGTGGSTAGTGGSTAGTGGSTAGTGGSTAGTGGSTAGTGGTDPGDAGPDATADGGDVDPPTDGGVEPIECPADLVEASEGADSSNGNQVVIITRLAFVGPNIEVTFRAIGGDFNFAEPLVLCTGSEDDDCDADVADLEGNGALDGGVGDLLEGEEVTFETPIGDIVSAESGEIALVNGLPSEAPTGIVRAYINWGDYISLEPTVGGGESLAARAAEEGGGGVWDLGDSVPVNGQTTIYATGDVTNQNDFEVCTQD